MKKSTKITFIVLGVLIILVGIIGITYAYFRTGGMQEQANTFTSGCLSITLSSNSSAITINNAYPISDVEGLEEEGYSFTITNNCDTSTNYAINLESQGASTLEEKYVKVSLSSDTVGNVISLLSDNPETEEGSGIYELYTGTLEGNGYKTYTLKLWIDYDATAEQAANKTYQSKINVIANPETKVIDTLEATFELSDMTLTANLTGGVESATYCITSDNVCNPSDPATIDNDSYSVDLSSSSGNKMVCTELNDGIGGTSKIICSEPVSISAKDYILAKYGEDDILKRESFDTTVTGDTTGTIYVSANSSQYDDYGEVYYFAGNPTDNWVDFAGYYWRIIRINGDGSIRMIYAGTDPTVTTGEGTQISLDGSNTFAFNNVASGSQYSYHVGYMYTEDDDASIGQHGNGTSSTIKETLDTWYSSKLSGYSNYLADSGFCGDREMASGSTWVDRPSSGSIYFAAYSRWGGTPTFKCNSSEEDNKPDLYTVDNSKGNQALDNPIGLITMDEVSYAGAYGTTNDDYYLYTNQAYWTMSPSNAESGGNARVFGVGSSGTLNISYVSLAYGVRPVINLRADVTLTGSGTVGNGVDTDGYDPYVVQTT